jgi:two-component system chemotaxis response regulator CheY
MFNKSEILVIAKTLTQRRDWLVKNISSPDFAATKLQNEQTLKIIESSLAKLAQLSKSIPPIPETPSKPVKLSTTEKRAQMEPKKINVLIVDDDELIASLMKALLQSADIHQIDIATDGLKGISMLYDANPVYDLVLCDWNMPIKNGLDVHNAMRAAERYMETCFILVTAVTEAKQIRSAIEEGVDDYIAKPIEEHTTLKKIARHFPKVVVNPE